MFRKMIAASLAALTLLAALCRDGQASPIDGPKTRTTRVEARSTDSFTVICRGGELTSVAVRGDGDTDLDLYVYDEWGNLIARDEDLSDQCFIRWTPRITGKFVIKLVNRGTVYNAYTIAVR